MKINEIFYSIQGEGRWTGLPNIFIRTTGCNLRCSYCDTKYAYEDGEKLTTNQIIDKIKNYKCKKICLTGGEPLLQKELSKLLDILFDRNYQICLETNGSKKINHLKNKKDLLISLDIKCPSSDMHKKMILENIKFLKKKDQLKFVIKNRKDYNYSKKIIDDFKPVCPVFFQPVWGIDYNKIVEWIVKDNLNVRFGIQLHKILGDIR